MESSSQNEKNVAQNVAWNCPSFSNNPIQTDPLLLPLSNFQDNFASFHLVSIFFKKQNKILLKITEKKPNVQVIQNLNVSSLLPGWTPSSCPLYSHLTLQLQFSNHTPAATWFVLCCAEWALQKAACLLFGSDCLFLTLRWSINWSINSAQRGKLRNIAWREVQGHKTWFQTNLVLV